MQDLNVWWDLGGRAVVALSPILVAALSYVSLKGAQLLHAKMKNECLEGILVRLDDAVFTSVCEVQQVIVEKLKAESDDGHLTEADREHVRDAALEAVRAYLGPKGLAEVGQILGIPPYRVNHHLESRLEAAVYELRSASPLVLNGHNAQTTTPAVPS